MSKHKLKHGSGTDSSSSDGDVAEEGEMSDRGGSESSNESAEWTATKSSSKKAAAKKKPLKRARRVKTDEDEDDDDDDNEKASSKSSSSSSPAEEGEASDVSEASDDDNSVEELASSGGGGDSSEIDEDDLIVDDADRAWLMQLTEKEREQELFNRIEKKRAEKKRREIEKKLRLLQKKKKKRSSESEEGGSPELGSPKAGLSSRARERREALHQKEHAHKKGALSALMAKRQARKDKEEEQRKRQGEAKSSAADADSSSSSDDDDDSKQRDTDTGLKGVRTANDEVRHGDSSSDSEAEERAREETRKRDRRPISSKEDIVKIRLSRDRVTRWCFMPFFNDVVKGCFVRIGIGNNPETNKPVYRLTQIDRVVETPKTYQVQCANSKLNTRTNKGLILKHGNAERTYRLEFISNQPPTDSEFEKWKEASEQANMPMPTMEFVMKKGKEIDEANTYELNDEDIEKMVNEKERFRRNPYNYAVKKHELTQQRMAAVAAGDSDLAQKLADDLEEVESRARELDFHRTRNVQMIDIINQRNREENMRIAEDAAAEAAAAAKKEAVKVADPFTRRHTRPVVSSQKLGKDTLLSPTQLAKQAAASIEVSSSSSSTNFSVNPLSADFLHSSIDLNISVTVPQLGVTMPSASTSIASTSTAVTSTVTGGGRRSLNLAEYNQRKGLM